MLFYCCPDEDTKDGVHVLLELFFKNSWTNICIIMFACC